MPRLCGGIYKLVIDLGYFHLWEEIVYIYLTNRCDLIGYGLFRLNAGFSLQIHDFGDILLSSHSQAR